METFRKRVSGRIQELRLQQKSAYGFRLMERLLSRFTSEADFFYCKGACAMDQGWFALGLESFAAAHLLDPANQEAELGTANALLFCGEKNLGKKRLKSFILRHPKDYQARVLLGQCLEQEGDWKQALKQYEQVRDQTDEPDFAHLFAHIGVCLMQLGREQQGFEHIEEAARLDGENPEIIFTRGVAYGHLGEFEAGLADMEDVIKKHPEDAEALAYSALYLFQLGQRPQSIARLEKAQELAPHSSLITEIREDIFGIRHAESRHHMFTEDEES